MTEAIVLDAPVKRPSTGSDTKPAIPKFALDAIGTQASHVSDILKAAADAIEELTAKNTASLPEPAKNFASTASSKLRGYADRATEDEAVRAVQALQRTAADHPVVTASIGAAIGAALGLALSRLGRPARA